MSLNVLSIEQLLLVLMSTQVVHKIFIVTYKLWKLGIIFLCLL